MKRHVEVRGSVSPSTRNVVELSGQDHLIINHFLINSWFIGLQWLLPPVNGSHVHMALASEHSEIGEENINITTLKEIESRQSMP
jgi:hypothetical protein